MPFGSQGLVSGAGRLQSVVRLLVIGCSLARPVSAAETRVPVTFTGGHETDRRDGGRPVVLIAGALGVTPELFREAFRGVTPSRNGPPTGDEARRNKAALMKVLGPHGITNDRLDAVSNYYRYQPQKGELWPTTSAKAYAIVEDGRIKQVVVTDGGSGYSSAPTASVQGLDGLKLTVTLRYGPDFRKNGSISRLEVAPAASN